MDERDQFLLDFHALYPGVTARVYARGVMDEGPSSYDDTVERVVDTTGTLLDLGCGDGYLLERARLRMPERKLVGVDMSEAELSAARARSIEGAQFIHARGDAMPFSDAAFGAVVSHMAFMLMTPVEPVVAEIARVLAPGGLFVAAVGGGPLVTDLDDAFAVYLPILRRHKDEFQRLPPRLGDIRARSPEGLRDLFCAQSGFGDPRIVDRVVRVDGSFEQVWTFASTFYEMGFVPTAQLDMMRGEFHDATRSIVGDDGRIPCAMRLTFVTARRLA